ncbi:SDR family NAD(P)-dependent oxidoreductase [Frondihabitans australicus]|uniref:NAD(P)-dependent dehydrogenase (Short-subunit alcohol dehydrogenase family) n=1 Tax=Frondihabitans australicus TaxID=386892 RepID=A0A495IL46_9MICO|nr:SDR family oxidoreductase [Frondihabitans australicus]RKR75855.1 NAD(P)-dependent dehydrogenase (short-subunit alcohol dehydrogenase family) [Frondihabitans australicus]
MESATFTGKTILVTGASAGIGFSIASALVAAGGTVIITGRREQALKDAAVSLDPSAVGIRADAAEEADLDALFARITETHGHLDGLVVNAGGGRFASLETVTAADIDAALAANVRGAILTIQKALPLLGEGSSIVSTGSTAAPGGLVNFGLYSASKAALATLTRTWATELAPRGIRVNDIVPGPTRTPGLAGLSDGADPSGLLAGLAAETLFNRLIEPSEVAAAALFLLSDASSGMTGSELFVDAGQAHHH